MPYNIYWPSEEAGTVAFGGRVLLPYERNQYLAMNPDSFEVTETKWPNPRGE